MGGIMVSLRKPVCLGCYVRRDYRKKQDSTNAQ
jgi:hypothetical protein